MIKKALIKKGVYYDSVTLMSIAKEIKSIEGIKETVIVMGTSSNKDILSDAGLFLSEVVEAEANDLIIVVEGQENIIDDAFKRAEELLNKKKSGKSDVGEYLPYTLDGALTAQPDSNLVLISVPGQYAAKEARKALEKGLHVMLFSDNVPLKDELELKKMAVENGLLMMGPDCGTAIINQAPLAFANVVNKGPVGIVAASGTGAQAVSSLIDSLGIGLSQVIGTGGRDLKSEVMGIEMLKDLQALAEDEETEVIILISKPPDRDVSSKLINVIKNIEKKVIVNFLGGDPSLVEGTDVLWAETLEDAAIKAAGLVKKGGLKFKKLTEEEISRIVKEEVKGMNSRQKYLRGLYTGGTLCSEASIILSKYGNIYSNITTNPEFKLKSDLKSIKNTLIDLGEDEFTRGKPHPMIEPVLRNERLLKEIEDDEVAVILLDVVLGYGSHPDPAGEVAKAVIKAKKKVADRGGYLSVIASVCGTSRDPQGLEKQKEKLLNAGIRLFPTNAQASRVAGEILKRRDIDGYQKN